VSVCVMRVYVYMMYASVVCGMVSVCIYVHTLFAYVCTYVHVVYVYVCVYVLQELFW
jgi:hypothetical protein